MISFDNYSKTGMNATLKWFLYLVVAAVGLYLVYRGVLYFWPDIFGPGPVIPPGAQGTAVVTSGNAGQGSLQDLGDGYGYSADAWNFQHSAQIGTQSLENVDPSNSVQKFEQLVDPVTGKTHWEPIPMQTPQDYVTADEFETIIDRHVQGYNKCQLDWMTTPSYLRNGDMWFGTIWPNDTGAPLSNLRGACVTPSDIVHHGIFRTDSSKWGEHPKCTENACLY